MTFNIDIVESLLAEDTEALEALPVAMARIANKENRIYAISGKKGSGKDTFSEVLASTRGTKYTPEAYARPVKDEAQRMFEVIASLHGTASIDDMVATLIESHHLVNIPHVHENMVKLVTAVCEDLDNGIMPHPYKRSPGAWASLRLLGTDIRRAQDDNYWVKKTVAATILTIADGVDVYINDVRFPNELQAAIAMDAVTIRMVVSPEVQQVRLLARDGTLPTEEALNHPSEIALDDATDFDFFIDNDGHVSLADNVASVLNAVDR